MGKEGGSQKKRRKGESESKSIGKELVIVLLVICLMTAVFLFFYYINGASLEEIKDFCLEVGITVAVNLLVVAVVLLIGWRRGKVKEDDVWEDGGYKVVRCSSGHYMLPVVTVLLDVAVGGFCLVWYLDEREAMVEALINLWNQKERFSFLFVIFMNVYCLKDFLQSCCLKVVYTRYRCIFIRFGRKKTVVWSKLQNIKYECSKRREKLFLTTEGKQIVLRSDVLDDGWEELLVWVSDVAECYQIPVEIMGKVHKNKIE